jgi:hypothetical protein
VPSGEITRTIFILLFIASIDCSTTLLDFDLSMGMPPSRRKNRPKGQRNMPDLPIQHGFILKESKMARQMGKSQLEVWGAAMTTYLSWLGACPSLFHPVNFK